ncbi:MAG: TolC family protein, partial [Muribaculaceae bacterium]|nr:TolC family protein [Muribaculaceae bacterium]
MMFRRQGILILMASVCIGVASAQSADTFSEVSAEDVTIKKDSAMPEKWTFSDCMNWAIDHSTDVKKALLSILQADQDVGSAKDAWLPTVGFSTNQSFTNYPVSTEGRNSNMYGSTYGVNASWTVWEGNVRKYRLNSAKILKEQQQLAGEDIVKNLTLNILSAYLNILYAQETVAIASQTLEVSTTQTARAKRLMESGRSSKVEYAQIESQMAQDQYNLVQAQGNLASAKMNLKKILALGLDYDIEIADISLSESDINAQLPTKEQTYGYAAAWLPGIKSNELSKEVYANDVKIAKAGNLPNIALQGGIGSSYNSGGNSWGWQIGHGLNDQVGAV